ncbi:MAG: alpha amylase C-terminal domain-containing protein [Smithella sp.]|jgi:1,4-alpha-glucan branching enzyme
MRDKQPEKKSTDQTIYTLNDRLQIILDSDPYLRPYSEIIERRLNHITGLEKKLIGKNRKSLSDFASGHEYFGLHKHDHEWIFREWAPHATKIFFVGEMTGWETQNDFALERITHDGIWEIHFPENFLSHGDLYRLMVQWPGGEGDRIPAYAKRVVQDPETLIFNAQVWNHPAYKWQYKTPGQAIPPLIYEAHVGMAQEEGKIGTYREFTEFIIPRIVRLGYNTIQLMGIQEHPYYASFGYHVSSFFAASSRFGTPDDLKKLIDTAHGAGLTVIMDIIHSHAVSNEVEGLSRFDGTLYQYFHNGFRGFHHAWDSRCFDYGKHQVLHFLLSNCRFWLDEYHFDGFRFDGITSMLYLDHGLEKAFTSYNDYFNSNVDEDALAYLALANTVIHDIRPDAITIAEDISGTPSLASPKNRGGIGFDYRLAMGIPDYWIKLVKDYRDEDWPLDHLWYELNNRRHDEKTISYAESHDQALVGDKTLMFWMAEAAMYNHMIAHNTNLIIDRAMALHKLIRLITLATAGHGYQNFMGNEFGHPEWIDFPRQGNNWSFHYARRQWHLTDDSSLKYQFLERFDRDMITLAKRFAFLEDPWPTLFHEHINDKVIVFRRGKLIFIFNFHPTASYPDYQLHMPPGKYKMILNTDDAIYGGHARLIFDQVYFTMPLCPDETVQNILRLYLPTRTAIILKLQS